MPADLTQPFKESCCDGGGGNQEYESARPCGCDKGANWVCQWHQFEQELRKKGLEHESKSK